MYRYTIRGQSPGASRLLRRAIIAFVAVLSCILISQAAIGGASKITIAVIKSLDLPEYNQALDGFLGALRATGYDPVTIILTLDGKDTDVGRSLDALRNQQPDLILALGTRAAVEITRREKKIPIVYSMVLKSLADTQDAEELSSQPNVTGASLNIPLRVQLQKIKRAFPTARRIGVISDPSQTKNLVDSVRAMAAASDLELCVQWVKNENDVPNSVRALSDSIDVFWMLPDPTVLTPRSSRFIIFELIKAGVPIMGLSSAYVKAGALLALDCDYEDIGRQSGELAVRVLSGQPPSELRQTQPRAFTLAINLKVREHLRVPLNDKVVKDTNVVTF